MSLNKHTIYAVSDKCELKLHSSYFCFSKMMFDIIYMSVKEIDVPKNIYNIETVLLESKI